MRDYLNGEKYLTEEDLLKEDIDLEDDNQELPLDILDGEDIVKDDLKDETVVEEDIVNDNLTDEQIDEEENLDKVEDAEEELGDDVDNNDDLDEMKTEIIDDDEFFVDDIASSGEVIYAKKGSKKHHNMSLYEYLTEYADYKEIDPEEEEEIMKDITPEEEMMNEIKPEEEFTKADLNEKKLEKEEKQNLTKKESIFAKVFNSVKNVVSHPVKTTKKVGNKIMDGFIHVSKNGLLVVLGVIVATGYLFRHPIKSVQNVFHALRHPIETYRNLKNTFNDEADYDYEEEKTETKEEIETETSIKEENTKANIYSKDEYVPPIELIELEGEELVRENTSDKEKESTKVLESLDGEEIIKNKSSNKETNENQMYEDPLASLDGEELSKDFEEVIKEEPLQKENSSKYNLNRNSAYENQPIDASEINVNRGSVNLYEEAVNGVENRESKYENQTSKKAYVKTK